MVESSAALWSCALADKLNRKDPESTNKVLRSGLRIQTKIIRLAPVVLGGSLSPKKWRKYAHI